MTFGEKLSNLRRAQNYTQEQFANLLGVSRQAVSRWESGTAYPETEKLIKIAEMFDCSVDYLLKESAEEPPTVKKEDPRNRLKVIALTVISTLVVELIIGAIIAAFIPRRATITISVPSYSWSDDEDYQLTYKEIASTASYPLPNESYLYTHGDWDLDRRGHGNSAFGVVDIKNVGKGAVGGPVFVDRGYEMLYLFDRSSGMWRIFRLDSYSDNAPQQIKIIVDQGKGEYYKYYVD